MEYSRTWPVPVGLKYRHADEVDLLTKVVVAPASRLAFSEEAFVEIRRIQDDLARAASHPPKVDAGRRHSQLNPSAGLLAARRARLGVSDRRMRRPPGFGRAAWGDLASSPGNKDPSHAPTIRAYRKHVSLLDLDSPVDVAFAGPHSRVSRDLP